MTSHFLYNEIKGGITMEQIVYRKTLDVHKNGIQFTLQGFETADNMARQIEISLMASGDTIDLPLEQIVAMVYVTTPNATEPSINECTIKDNTIIYDVLPITEEGITEMQIKLIDTRAEGANGVLPSPKFAVEVSKSATDDESATQTTTYTALEDAVAKAKGVYDARLIRIELDNDCMFRAYFADGTMYESDVLKELFLKGDALVSQSYAKGGTGVRAGEDTDNSMYYSNVSKSASAEAKDAREQSAELLEEARQHGIYTAFSVDFESGEVKYISPTYGFNINEENGELEVIGKAYTPSETVELVVTEWLTEKSAELQESIGSLSAQLDYRLNYADNNLKELADAIAANTGDIAANTSAIEAEIDARQQHVAYAVSEAVSEIEKSINKLYVDYIVEQGEVDIISDTEKNTGVVKWTYEKWNSGKIECWGKVTNLRAGYTDDDGYNAVGLPCEIYNPVANFTNYSWQVHRIRMLEHSNPAQIAFVVKTGDATLSLPSVDEPGGAKVSITIKGRWKE